MSFGIMRISKGKVQQAIEKVVNHPELRSQFFQKLKQDRSTETPDTDWIAFLREPDHGNLQLSTEKYFRERWLGSPSWQNFKVEAIVRQSLIKAIELANHPKRPIENYWIWMDGPEKFEIALHETPRQVTRIILTSPLNDSQSETITDMPATATPLPFWIVKRHGEPPTPASAFEKVMDEKPQEGWAMVQLFHP